MSTNISLIQRVQIASPCTASWDEMTGDDKSRFCSHCRLNVYNLSTMTQDEAERLIIEKEGKLCARIYRRKDGTILTRDCPVELAAIRKRARLAGVKVAAVLVFVASAAMAVVAGDRRSDLWKGVTHLRPTTYSKTVNAVRRWMNTDPAPTPPILGRVAPGATMGLLKVHTDR